MNNELFQKISKRIDSYRNDMVELQKKIIPIKAMDPTCGGEGEMKKGEFLKPYLKEIFDEVKEYPFEDKRVPGGKRPNYLCRLKGKSNKKTIWIMTHLDVVPSGDDKLWNTKPWEGVVKDGKIYGRGSIDNNSPTVNTMFAAKAFKAEGIKPNYDLVHILVSDEETLNSGIEHLINNPDVKFEKQDEIIVPDYGSPEADIIEVAEKSIVQMKFTIIGKQSHAMSPNQGINAHRAGAYLIVKLDNLHKDFPDTDPTFQEPCYSTIEPTKKENNIPNINTIPGSDIIYYDCRIMPSVDLDVFLNKVKDYTKEIEKQFGVTIKIETPNIAKAPPPTPNNSPLVKKLQAAIKEVHGTNAKPIGIGGGTVAKKFRERGLHTVVYNRVDDVYHQPNEFCVIDYMIGDAKVWAYLLLQD